MSESTNTGSNTTGSN